MIACRAKIGRDTSSGNRGLQEVGGIPLCSRPSTLPNRGYSRQVHQLTDLFTFCSRSSPQLDGLAATRSWRDGVTGKKSRTHHPGPPLALLFRYGPKSDHCVESSFVIGSDFVQLCRSPSVMTIVLTCWSGRGIQPAGITGVQLCLRA